jgi:hypothetical protein
VTGPAYHGRTHLAGGTDPIPGLGAGGVDAFFSPVILPILMNEANGYDGFGWTGVSVDSTVRNNAVRTNGKSRTPAINDFFTHGCTLGPQGAMFGLGVSYKAGSDCGIITFSLASMASPDTDRAGVSDAGTLTDAALIYVTIGSLPLDTYAASSADVGTDGYQATFRLMGAAGDPLTVSSGSDAFTGVALLDGGPGFYKLKAEVTSKNASSTGYRAQFTGLAFVRLDDSGFL